MREMLGFFGFFFCILKNENKSEPNQMPAKKQKVNEELRSEDMQFVHGLKV